jgi:ParB family chromosome partitioning protein
MGEQANPFEGGDSIPKFDEKADGRVLLNIPIDMISANPYQPRKSMDESELSELSASIRELGVLQPILVRQISPVEYELIAGERRLRAAKRANLASIPAMLMETTPLSQQVMALVENIQRKNLSAIEEAVCLQDILSKTGWSQSDLAKRMGRSQASIANKLRLLRLDESVQQLVIGGKLGERQARALLSLSMEEQRRLAQKTIDDDLSTRELEDLVEKWGDSPRPTKASKKKTISEGVQPEMMNELVSIINKYRAKGVPAKMRIKQNDAECILVEISADFPKQN